MLIKGQRKLKARLQTRKWLFGGISRAEELYESRVQASYDFSIQVYNVIPSEYPIFRLTGVGDIAGVRELFSTGQASPFDRDENGLTVLDVRLGRGSYYSYADILTGRSIQPRTRGLPFAKERRR